MRADLNPCCPTLDPAACKFTRKAVGEGLSAWAAATPWESSMNPRSWLWQGSALANATDWEWARTWRLSSWEQISRNLHLSSLSLIGRPGVSISTACQSKVGNRVGPAKVQEKEVVNCRVHMISEYLKILKWVQNEKQGKTIKQYHRTLAMNSQGKKKSRLTNSVL